MTPRERFIAALERQPLTGRVPHFELIFYPTMEAFGKVHFDHRNYSQWEQMTTHERQAHREDMANLYIAIAQRYEHSAIFLRPNPVGNCPAPGHVESAFFGDEPAARRRRHRAGCRPAQTLG